MACGKVAFLLLVAGVIPALCQVQRAVLYDQPNGQGEYVMIPDTYVPDLTEANFDNRARSVCVTGIWLFYQDINFNSAGSRGMEYVFGKDNYCVNLRTIQGTVTSLRFAGQPKDWSQDSLTLYQYDYFQGTEEYVVSELPNLNLIDNHQSIIITGDSHFSVFDKPFYQGNSICLRVPESGTFTPAFLSNTESISPDPIPHGSIRSIRRGCAGRVDRNITLQSFERANFRNHFVSTHLKDE